MFFKQNVTHAETELEYQRLKTSHEDNLAFTSVDAMFARLVPDGYGGINLINTERAKKFRNTLRRIATVQTLLRSYRK